MRWRMRGRSRENSCSSTTQADDGNGGPPMKRDRTEEARLIVTELRRSLDQPNYDVNENQSRYDSAIPLCSGKCLEYLQRRENWFHEGRLKDAKRALTNALRKYLGGD